MEEYLLRGQVQTSRLPLAQLLHCRDPSLHPACPTLPSLVPEAETGCRPRPPPKFHDLPLQGKIPTRYHKQLPTCWWFSLTYYLHFLLPEHMPWSYMTHQTFHMQGTKCCHVSATCSSVGAKIMRPQGPGTGPQLLLLPAV